MHRQLLRLGPLLLIALSSVSLSAARSAITTTSGSVIAYVSPSRENQQIRLVNPDGSADRLLWSLPAPVNRADGISTLSWKPDASELAFSSAHDGQRSLLASDLYAVSANGVRVRRLTAPPGPVAGRPTGTVTLRVENYAGGKELYAYVEGAPDFVRFTAPSETAWIITFTNVVDYGPGVRQFARVYNATSAPLNFQCWFDAAASADVQPGQVASAGTLTSLMNTSCPYAFMPSWSADGNSLSYLYREIDRALDRPNNIWRVASTAAPGTVGERLLNMGQYVARDEIFLLAQASPARPDELLFVENGATNNFIYRAPVDDAENHTNISLGLCPRTTCFIPGLAWLPDGSGFVFARVEAGSSLGNPPPAGGAIYRYDFASSRFNEILRVPGEAIGRLAIAPDGQTIVFERAAGLDSASDRVVFGPRLLCPCSLWTVATSGGTARQLVADGRAPAWSPAAPSAAPERRVQLPLIAR
jgi:hypothetical protein